VNLRAWRACGSGSALPLTLPASPSATQGDLSPLLRGEVRPKLRTQNLPTTAQMHAAHHAFAPDRSCAAHRRSCYPGNSPRVRLVLKSRHEVAASYHRTVDSVRLSVTPSTTGKRRRVMSRLMCLLLLLTGFAAFTSLASSTSTAVAAANCPKGATCKCVPTKFTNCTVVGGKQTCTQSKGERCTVVSGPGSGKRAQ
jgi:hypothetical protein